MSLLKRSLLCTALLVASPLYADWFNVPGGRAPATAPADPATGAPDTRTGAIATPDRPLPARARPMEAALSDHAVFFAMGDLGLTDERLAATTARLAQTESVTKLGAQDAFLVGSRYAARLQREMQRLANPARAAATRALADAAEYRCMLPLPATGVPRDAAIRLEQAIYAANLAIRAQGVRLEFSRWLEEAVAGK